MSKPYFSIELKNRFPASEWHWLLLALRQDDVVWSALEDEEFSRRALDSIPANGAAWSPAALSLLSLDNLISLEELRLKQIQPQEDVLSGRASKVYEDWIRKPSNPDRLDTAGLLALTLLAQFRVSGSWREIFRLEGLTPSASKTPFACVFGMTPHPMIMIRELLQSKNSGWAKLGVHVLLSNPTPPENQLVELKNLAEELDSQSLSAMLETLSAFRPNLAALLAKQLLENPPAAWNRSQYSSRGVDAIGQLEQMLMTIRSAQVHQIAGQADLAVPVVADGLKMIRKVRGHLSAQLAQSVAHTKDLTTDEWGSTAQAASLEAWKQAVQLAPDEPLFVAQYAMTFFKAGKFDDALSILKHYFAEETKTLTSELMLTYALVLDKVNDVEEAKNAADQAHQLYIETRILSEQDSIALADFFLKYGAFDKAQQVALIGLEDYPSNRDLLAILAKIHLNSGNPEEAAGLAYAAQASAAYRRAIIGELAAETEPAEVLDSNLGNSNEQKRNLQTLLVDSLEALNAWEPAYQERLALLDLMEDPDSEDLRALAHCAAGAKKFETVIEISQRLLRLNPNDLIAHQQIADASEALGDFDAAIEHFNRTIQLSPDQAAFWKGLVRVKRLNGDETGAFETLRSAGQALSDDPDIQLELGEVYLSQGSPTLALPYLRKAQSAAVSPEMMTLVAERLGRTLFQLGRLDESREVLEQVILQSADQKTGIPMAETVNSSKPDTDIAFTYARTLLALGEPEKAVQLLTQVVRDRPEDPIACLDLVKAMMQLGDRVSGAKRALPFLQKLLGIVPDGSLNGYSSQLEAQPKLRAESRVLLAEAYAATGDWGKAMDAFRQAMEEPANQEKEMQTRLSIGLGLTALKLELPEMAVAALQDAAHAEPLNLQVQRNLSEAYLSNGLAQDAFQAAKVALEIAPSDIDTLIWFIDQGMRIASLPGSSQNAIHDDLIKAMQAVLSKAPDRADILLRLGGILFLAGKRAEAVEVFRKLVNLDTLKQQIDIRALYQAGLDVLDTGDARLAAALLQKSISQMENNGSGRPADFESIGVADLYLALEKALENLGDFDGALEAINRALDLENARIILHIVRADLLFKIGRFDSARDGLMEAIQRWPEEALLHQRMAQVLRAQGSLMEALKSIETGITLLSDPKNKQHQREIYLLASRLAFASLRPRRAFAYFQSAIPETDADFNRFEYAILRAELAIEAGEEQIASEAVSTFESQAAQSAAALAVSSRVAVRKGQKDEAMRTCRSAVRAWTKQQLNQPGQTPATTKDEFIAELSTIGMAALENRQWDHALSVFRQMVEMFPEEPQAHYKLAQALVIIAEAKSLSEDFDVIQNAPPKDSLLDAAFKQFEANLNSAASQTGSSEILKSGEITGDWDVEIKRAIGICGRRGRACFQPTIENAAALEYMLQTLTPEVSDVSALVMVYRKCGVKDRAIRSAKLGSHPVFEGKDPRDDPQIVANLALAEIDPQKAIEVINDSLENILQQGMPWPEVPMMRYLLAKLYFMLKDYPSAKEELHKALTEWPDEPRWQAFSAQLRLAEPSDNRLQQLAEAVESLEKATNQEPENSAHQLALGKVYFECGQYQRAVKSLTQATRLEPKSAEGWLALAKAQNSIGDLDQAALSAEHAIDQSDQQIDALLLRAEIAIKTNNYRGALSRAQAVLRVQPDHPQGLTLLAQSLIGLNRPAEALAAIDKAIPRSADPLSLQLQRLELIHRAEGLEPGLKALQELVAQNPKQAAYLALLANWLQDAGKQDAAIQAARLALQEGLEGLTFAQRAELHTMIGLHLRKAGQLDQAVHHLSEAISLASDHLDAYLELGRVYQERREYQQALKVYQKAINMAGGDYRPYYYAGLALKDNKDYMASEAMLRKAAQLAPNEVSVHRLLGAVVALNLVHGHRLAPAEVRAE